MAKAFYVGVNDVARKVESPYAEAGGVARDIIRGYIGIDDVARKTFEVDRPSGWFTFYDSPPDVLMSAGYYGIKTFSFPFTTLDGLTFSSIVIDDSMMVSIYELMYFDNTVIYSRLYEDNFGNNNPPYWRSRNDKSIYLDNLKLGVDISEEAYAFLLTVAYPDDSLGGKPQTYILEAGRYVFNDDIIDGGLFPYDWNAPAFSISVPFKNDGMYSPTFTKFEYRHYFDMIESFEIDYVKEDGTSEEAYNHYYNYDTNTTRSGWVGSQFAVTLLSDVQVSKSVYDWWALNIKKS